MRHARRGVLPLDSRALTRIQSLILVTVIVVAAIGGTLAYVLSGWKGTSETIKIGILADLGSTTGTDIWQGVMLAAEQLNDEGGIIGRQVEVVGEDTDAETVIDVAKINSALTRLLTYHKVDFIIGQSFSEGFMVQELIAEHKRVFFEVGANLDAYTQRVLDDYDRYKYYFRVSPNSTAQFLGMTDSLLLVREQTGFNKIGLIGEEGWTNEIIEGLSVVLPELGFDLVYEKTLPPGTGDFTSYFAAAESAGVEIMLPLIYVAPVPFVKEYYERQSPMVIYGGYLGQGILGPRGWEITDGKCEFISSAAWPITAGYPLTNKTLPDREAYIDRWNEIPDYGGGFAYGLMRYVLPDAIRRAETLEVNAVIEALEQTSIETCLAENSCFTSSHDSVMGENPSDPDADYLLVILFQWIDGKQVPVYPKRIMEGAEVTYTFPDWSGPWD